VSSGTRSRAEAVVATVKPGSASSRCPGAGVPGHRAAHGGDAPRPRPRRVRPRLSGRLPERLDVLDAAPRDPSAGQAGFPASRCLTIW
jgi:hypothetical protein